jgi:hypothetical protein
MHRAFEAPLTQLTVNQAAGIAVNAAVQRQSEPRPLPCDLHRLLVACHWLHDHSSRGSTQLPTCILPTLYKRVNCLYRDKTPAVQALRALFATYSQAPTQARAAVYHRAALPPPDRIHNRHVHSYLTLWFLYNKNNPGHIWQPTWHNRNKGVRLLYQQKHTRGKSSL